METEQPAPAPAAKKRMVLAVKSLLVRDGRALILRRGESDTTAPGIWEFPGGKLEFGERPDETLIREVAEETGLSATPIRVAYAATMFTSPQRQVVIINYLAAAGPGDVILSFEHQDYHWAAKGDMLRMLDGGILENLRRYRVLEDPALAVDD